MPTTRGTSLGSSSKIKRAVIQRVMDRMFDPSQARPTFPVMESVDPRAQQQVVDEVEAEEHPQHDARSYYDPGPRVFHAQPPQSVDVLEKISKETIILVFAAFFIGLLLGKSLTPVILKH
jgi:hypothetical protein